MLYKSGLTVFSSTTTFGSGHRRGVRLSRVWRSSVFLEYSIVYHVLFRLRGVSSAKLQGFLYSDTVKNHPCLLEDTFVLMLVIISRSLLTTCLAISKPRLGYYCFHTALRAPFYQSLGHMAALPYSRIQKSEIRLLTIEPQ
jgi:hypothetical protein